MAVNVRNLIAGPAIVHVGAFGVEEPDDALVAMPAGWRDLGGTTGGVRQIMNRDIFNLEVDQIPEPVGARVVGRGAQISTTMAEPTLDNWALAMGELEDAVVSSGAAPAAVTESLEPSEIDPSTEPNYVAVCLTGPGPDGKTRRVILRKVLSTESIESANEKAGQTGIPVTFTAYRVSQSIRALRMMDTAPATA